MKILILSILTLTLFVACSAKKEKTSIDSYDKAKMQHQIDRAKKAYNDLNEELKK